MIQTEASELLSNKEHQTEKNIERVSQPEEILKFIYGGAQDTEKV